MKIKILKNLMIVIFIFTSKTVYANDFKELYTDTKSQLVCAQEEISKLHEANFNCKNTILNNEKHIQSLSDENTNLKSLIGEQNSTILSLQLYQKEAFNYKNFLNEKILAYESLLKETKDKQDLIDKQSFQIKNLETSLAEQKIKHDNILSQYNSVNSQLNEAKNIILIAQNEIKNAKEIEQQRTQNNIVACKSISTEENVNLKALELLKTDKTHSAILYFNLGKVYQQNKDFKKAIENFQLAILSNPEFYTSYCQLGLSYAEIGDYQNAAKFLNEYIKFSLNEKEKELVKSFIIKLKNVKA